MDFFLTKIIHQAQKKPATIVLPESNDVRVLRAAAEVQKRGIANIILLGNSINLKHDTNPFSLDGIEMLDPLNSHLSESLSLRLFEMRKHKGLTREQANTLLRDPIYFGVMLVEEGLADGLVAGAVHSTADVIRPALQIIRAADTAKIVSSFFIMEMPDPSYGHNGYFLFSDCALIENPNAEQLSEIAIASVQSFQSFFATEPKVAMLSYSTLGSAKSSLTQKVIDATELTKRRYPNLLIDGEFQVDTAIVPSVSKQKAPNSPIVGDANILIFPNLEAGNIGYKLTQRLAHANAYGPITQGLRKPVNDLSRGCSWEDIMGVIAITAVQAQKNRVKKAI